MSEFNPSSEPDFVDPLVAQLASLRPADPGSFESRVMYSAGRADAIREFSVRARHRVWWNAAAMLLIAAGSSAATWNFSARIPVNTIASTMKPTNETIAPGIESATQSTDSPVAVAQSSHRPSTAKSVNQLLDELLRQRGQSPWMKWELPDSFSSDPSTQPVSTGPKTWLQLQRELLKESNIY